MFNADELRRDLAKLGLSDKTVSRLMGLYGARARDVWDDPFDPLRLLYENFIPIHAMAFDRGLVDEGCAFDESLAVLEQGGFICLVGGAAGDADTVQGVPSLIPEAEMTTVQEARTRAVRAVNELLGPSADALAMAIEAAQSGDELRPLIREAERLVTLAHGAAAAQAFIVGIRRR